MNWSSAVTILIYYLVLIYVDRYTYIEKVFANYTIQAGSYDYFNKKLSLVSGRNFVKWQGMKLLKVIYII